MIVIAKRNFFGKVERTILRNMVHYFLALSFLVVTAERRGDIIVSGITVGQNFYRLEGNCEKWKTL